MEAIFEAMVRELVVKHIYLPFKDKILIEYENPDGKILTYHSPNSSDYEGNMLSAFDDYLQELHQLQLAHDEELRKSYRDKIKARVEEVRLGTQVPSYTNHYYALTIRPEEAFQNIDSLSQIVDYVNHASCVKRSWWCFEQTSQGDEQVTGIHVHMTIESTYPVSKVKQYIMTQRLLKKDRPRFRFRYPDRAVLFKECYNNDWFENYMKGDKYNSEKDPKVAKDIVWRRQNGLSDIYSYVRQEEAQIPEV